MINPHEPQSSTGHPAFHSLVRASGLWGTKTRTDSLFRSRLGLDRRSEEKRTRSSLALEHSGQSHLISPGKLRVRIGQCVVQLVVCALHSNYRAISVLREVRQHPFTCSALLVTTVMAITWTSTLEIEHDAKYPSQYHSTHCSQVTLHVPPKRKSKHGSFTYGSFYGDQISYHPSCFSGFRAAGHTHYHRDVPI